MVELSYSKEIIKHFKNPRNLGRMKNPDAVGEAGNLLCVASDTPIETNNTLVPIRDIYEKNLVLSHEGIYYPIKALHKRVYEGEVILIKNRLGEVILTPEHLILAKKIPKEVKFSRTENKKKIPLGWYHAAELKKGDIIAYSIPKEEKDVKKIKIGVEKFKYDFKSKPIPSTIPLNENFLKLVGYYLAEGYASTVVTQSLLQFTLNINEVEIAKEISEIVKEIFGLETKIYHVKEKKTIIVNVYSSLLARFFKKMFGGYAEDKHLPHFMILLPKEKQKYVIYGLWKGDGYVNLKRKDPRAGFSTISHQLAHQLKLLLLRQGIIPSLYVEKEKIRKGVYHKKSYRVHIGQKDSLLKLCDILGIKWNTKKFSQRKSWIDANYLYMPIMKIEKQNYAGLVCNLEVERAHSFVTDCVTLHNCGDVMRIYLRIKEKNGKKIISDIKGEVFGCIVAVSNTSMLTTMVKGKSLEDALKIEKEELIERLGGRRKIPAFKIHCSILALDALHEAIYNYYKKNKIPIPKDLEKEHERIQKTLRTIEERHKEFIELERGLME
jgi:NifU-like protein involved in Fe-S cluster formation